MPSVAYAQNSTTTILSSNFNAHGSPDGATSFSGISWATNGVYIPVTTITLSPDAVVQQNGSAQNSDRLAVQHNIDTEGSWTIGIPFVSVVDGVVIQDLTFDYQFINSGGVNQRNPHPDSGLVDVAILDTSFAVLAEVQLGPLGTNDRDSNQGTGIVADLDDVELKNGAMYLLGFSVASDSTVGNNMSIDNLVLHGSIGN
ncbi:MAG: hypothetical protein F6K30_24695 [Cyanothece sp. SIO2G6]|nr:hypothetical protein [Cyanothece sp. SIO2G6]